MSRYLRFKKIYVMGAGAMPLHCAELLLAKGHKCTFLDTNSNFSPFVSKRLKRLGVSYFHVSQNNLTNFFCNTDPVLVISASNLLIFPQELVKLPQLTIFNYHNSLLPKHKGVNAEAWTIYNGDKTAGVTWHKVEEKIDSGGILAQKEFMLPDNITSGELLKLQAREALHLLNNHLDLILSATYLLRPQPVNNEISHKKIERPHNGLLSPEWDSIKIWRFVRAYDYGVSKNLGSPLININGKLYSWRSYQKISKQFSGNISLLNGIRIKDIILLNLYPISE